MPDDRPARSGRGALPGRFDPGDGEPPTERLEATVIGAVQGVGFRWFVTEAAARLELRGWVANRADGAVLCVAEGPRTALEELLRELARGPISAQVDRVIPAWMPATGRFSRFEIRSGSHPGD
ncbi:MAG TPA: acylphosphatase [Candidatus Limnocylindrales bacterium]